jgi:hypothetical protein
LNHFTVAEISGPEALTDIGDDGRRGGPPKDGCGVDGPPKLKSSSNPRRRVWCWERLFGLCILELMAAYGSDGG